MGSLSRKLTKTQAAKIAKAAKSRNARRRSTERKVSKPSQGKPSRPSKKAATSTYGTGDWDEFEGEEFPEESQAIKEDFANRVRAAASSVAPPSLQAKIKALSTEAIWQAYNEDAYIFELYFRYHSAYDTPHTSDVSVWIYQFINRVQQYMGVTE